ncbi:hypothetical protein [Euzebyella saccharophila]|uniref:Lipoprotein n=1 Tax=Euzebyella saccharophila TaxID=679664 RepID=A0ABV8JYE3_9FLAO|nr:hypothetical protein [Euzebyella saccharophila]
MSNVFSNTRNVLLATASVALLFSCSDEAKESIEEFQEEQKVSKTELQTILETVNVSGEVDELVSELYDMDKSGSAAKVEEECYIVDYSDTGFTLSFDDCSAKEDGELLNGTISVVYGGDNENYAFTVTYNDLMVGDVSIDGTRSFKINSSEEEQSISWTVYSDMDIVLADGAEVAEEGEKTVGFVFGEEFGSGALTLDGEWILKSEGNTYIVDITEILEAQFGCEHFGKGVMALSKNGLEVSVNFGDGTCDDVATLIYPNEAEEEISLKD